MTGTIHERQHVGAVLKAERERRGLSPTEAAAKAGISQAYVCQIEQRERPTGAGAIRYAESLGFKYVIPEPEPVLTRIETGGVVGGDVPEVS